MVSLIGYFARRPLVANVLMFGLIVSSFLFWTKIGKEEMPEFAANHVRINVAYPGASAEDIELFITKPIEEKLKGIAGLEQVNSSSAYGSSSFNITFEPKTKNLQEKIQEVKDAVDAVELPREAEEPVFRQFRSSEKAIVDIGIYLKEKEILDVSSRIELQKYVLAFKNKLLSLKQISGVDATGYLRPELHIKMIPERLRKYEISMNQVKEQIVQQHVRKPIGSMTDREESEITIISELDDIESLENVIVSSGFQGQKLKLSKIANIEHGFEKAVSVTKVQGHEGVILKVKKSSNVDILTAHEAVVQFIRDFKTANLKSPVDFVLIDDESYDVRNRLSLIGANGVLGFILIVLILFLFLDFKSGVWVAMGIPFSLAFTLLVAFIAGYTVNNMTLSAIIIVLGIVVDDAIIVAENISRRRADSENSAVEGTKQVILPIIASVLTTCAAFIPLYFFSGWFGVFIKYIPTLVFLMLGASLLESIFILPAHMSHSLPFERFVNQKFGQFREKREKLTYLIEEKYSNFLKRILEHRKYILLGFFCLLIASGFLFKLKMKYVMFPREESRKVAVRLKAPEGVTRYEMARLISPVEQVFLNDHHNVVTSVRSRIGQSRRGGAVKENESTIVVEILPPSEREISLNDLISFWESKTINFNDFTEIKYLKSRFGSDSGSPIAIEVQENDDRTRDEVVKKLKAKLEKISALANVDVEKPVTKNEYRLELIKNEVSRLGINYEQLSSTLRAYVEGDILYTLNSGEEEVDVRFTSTETNKDKIEKLLSLTVANKEGYLVPIKGLVKVHRGIKPSNIQRVDFKRTSTVYADLASKTKTTPLEIASYLEKEIFPRVVQGSPSTVLKFKGEIKDSREAQSDFSLSLILVLSIVYVLLVFLFDSLWTPFLIGAIIPFGIVGVIFAFWTHGMSQYGFFAVIGTLGMIGVVINDSIVLISKLKESVAQVFNSRREMFDFISETTSTRLRAVLVTTLTTVAGLFPTAYGLGGYDSMLAEMMLAMGWGLLFGMFITLLLVPCIYSFYLELKGLRLSK